MIEITEDDLNLFWSKVEVQRTGAIHGLEEGLKEVLVSKLKIAEITMGLGRVDTTIIEYNGKRGILFHPRKEYRPVGSEGSLQPGEYWPSYGDVIIWIENEAGARVIESQLKEFLDV